MYMGNVQPGADSALWCHRLRVLQSFASSSQNLEQNGILKEDIRTRSCVLTSLIILC